MSFSVEITEDGWRRLKFYGSFDHTPKIGEEFVFYSGSGRHCFYWDGMSWVGICEFLKKQDWRAK